MDTVQFYEYSIAKKKHMTSFRDATNYKYNFNGTKIDFTLKIRLN
jgi:hypothetical protein